MYFVEVGGKRGSDKIPQATRPEIDKAISEEQGKGVIDTIKDSMSSEVRLGKISLCNLEQ